GPFGRAVRGDGLGRAPALRHRPPRRDPAVRPLPAPQRRARPRNHAPGTGVARRRRGLVTVGAALAPRPWEPPWRRAFPVAALAPLLHQYFGIDGSLSAQASMPPVML